MLGKYLMETIMSWRNQSFSTEYETLSNNNFLITQKGEKGQRNKVHKS